MANSIVVVGAAARLFVNNVIYTVTQSVSVTEVIGAYPIYGINSPYPQEIATGGQNMVTGTVEGIRIRGMDSLQSANLLSLFQNLAATNYCSLRLENRQTGETIWSIQKAQVKDVMETVKAKGTMHFNFSFIGQIIYRPLDLS